MEYRSYRVGTTDCLAVSVRLTGITVSAALKAST